MGLFQFVCMYDFDSKLWESELFLVIFCWKFGFLCDKVEFGFVGLLNSLLGFAWRSKFVVFFNWELVVDENSDSGCWFLVIKAWFWVLKVKRLLIQSVRVWVMGMLFVLMRDLGLILFCWKFDFCDEVEFGFVCLLICCCLVVLSLLWGLL